MSVGAFRIIIIKTGDVIGTFERVKSTIDVLLYLKAPTDTRSFRPFCPDGLVGSRKMVSVWPKTVLLAGVQPVRLKWTKRTCVCGRLNR